MTPFGKFMRHLRLDKGLMLKESAEKLGVTSAYLSALEHGKKGCLEPSWSIASLLSSALMPSKQKR